MQSNVKQGSIRILAGEDLTDKQDYLVYLTHDTNVPEVKLPSNINAIPLYVVEDDNTDGEYVDVQPIEAGKQIRVALKGTCVPGDILVNADPATAADRGKVRILPTDAGTYRGIGVAEEAGVDGQSVLTRPAMLGLIVVTA